jgi:nucleoside-triphosphatase THEP1
MKNVTYLDNPLLTELPLPIDFNNLPALLHSEPLLLSDLQDKTAQQRAHLLGRISSHFIPTSASVEIADAILGAIFSGYEERNPCLAEVKKRRYLVGGWQGPFNGVGPGFVAKNVRCVTIEGITGLGKSTIVDRTLSLLPQVVMHGPSEAAGWTMQKQLVWVKVDMTSDGSRIGFLMQLFQQIDAALGTDYLSQFSTKKYSVENNMVWITRILYNCFCGVLIIEEIQARNFSEASSRNAMLLFFLRLLNLGIPIVLIGNPQGFQGFADFSQDLRRLSSGGRFEVWPAMSASDPDWAEFLVPGMLQFNVMPELPMINDAGRLLYACTGGVYDFLAKLLAQAQLLALRRGQQRICDADLIDAYNGPTIKASHTLIRALADRSISGLREFSDIPHEAFAVKWAEINGSSGRTISEEAPADLSPTFDKLRPPKEPQPRFKTAEQAYKRRASSEVSRKRRDIEKQPELPTEDLRSGGLKDVLLDNFETMKRQREGGKS